MEDETPVAVETCCSKTRKIFSIAIHVVLAFCCILLAIANRVGYLEYFWPPGVGTDGVSSPFFHRVVATDFRKETSQFQPQLRCPLVYAPNNDTSTSRGVDSLCTCLMRKTRIEQEQKNVQECLEIDGAMPVYVLHYAGIIPSADYVLWAFLCITASCLTSFSRLEGYPNLNPHLRWILPGFIASLNLSVLALNFWVWTGDSDGFETPDNIVDRQGAPETCATIRFVFAFIIFGFMLHIPHLLAQFNFWFWYYEEGFLMQGYSDLKSGLQVFREMRSKTEAVAFRDKWNDSGLSKSGDKSYVQMQSKIYASELNQRDEQFRVGFWQAVSEDLNFTTGGVLLAVVFSAHAGVHDDSTLLMDVCCVGGVGFLQHMSHVLMLVKEYVFQDSAEDHKEGVGNEDDMSEEMEADVCRHIGNTRVMIHFFVFALVVFYCNRASPSTFNDTELKNFFEVGRFSVILALLACNTMYDIFFEIVHVIKHMTQVGPGFQVNASDYKEGTNYAAKNSFLAYHAQYRGPYLWRVHLLLPFMLFFGAVVFFQQDMRPVLNIEARVVLV